MSTYVCEWTWLWSQLDQVDCNKDDNKIPLEISINYDKRSGVSEQPIASPFLEGSLDNVHCPQPSSDRYSLRIIHPPLATGILHAKVIVIEFTMFIRVVISSANLTHSDWSILGQTLSVLDFARHPQPQHSPFATELSLLLTHLGFSFSTSPFSFPDTTNIHIVSSIPNVQSGLECLSRLITERSDGPVVYQTSAVGATTKRWLDNFRQSLQCDDLQIVYPSHDTVQSLTHTQQLECVTIRFADPSHTIRSSNTLHDAIITPPRPLHSKIIIASSWIYHGSHNLTESSWSKSNYEAGLFFDRSLLPSPLPLTFALPPPPYLPNQRPWILSSLTTSRQPQQQQTSDESLPYHYRQFLTERFKKYLKAD
eukprot:gene2899-3329_t